MSKAFITLEKGNYISRVLFISTPLGFDILGCVHRQLPDGEWKLDYRFRYYEDDKAHESKDRKTHFAMTIDASTPESVVAEKTERAFQMMCGPMGGELDVTVIESDEPRVFHHLMSGKPYMFGKYERARS